METLLVDDIAAGLFEDYLHDGMIAVDEVLGPGEITQASTYFVRKLVFKLLPMEKYNYRPAGSDRVQAFWSRT